MFTIARAAGFQLPRLSSDVRSMDTLSIIAFTDNYNARKRPVSSKFIYNTAQT